MVVFLAVRLPLTLKEVLGANLLLTVGAHKVLRVPRSAHGSHHLVGGRHSASKCNELQRKKAGSAVRTTSTLHARRKGITAMYNQVCEIIFGFILKMPLYALYRIHEYN